MEEKPNIKCQKCGYEWHTKSKLKMVTCPSCNQKIPNITLKPRRLIKKLIQQKRGIIGLEAAIVLIAFVIIAAAFSFMVVNQGLYATERGKVVIQEGLKQASTPLTIDGTTFVRTTPDGKAVDVIIIPVKAFGVKFVPVGRNQTVIVLRIGEKAWANAYLGVLYTGYNGTPYPSPSYYYTDDSTFDPTGRKFDDFVGFRHANQTQGGESRDVYVNGTYNIGHAEGLYTGAVLAIAHSNGDEALDTNEKGFLIITLASDAVALARTPINIEIRLEKSATLSIEITIPESMPQNTYVPIF
ncbi:MAG: archaellin/type IV pilin N-terminal domain-containing protein [Candidatus Bathyarchaeia archaeon]